MTDEKLKEIVEESQIARSEMSLSVVTEWNIGTIDRPKSLDPKDLRGTEQITIEEVQLPRLAISQGLSPQMVPDSAEFIKGLTLFDLFNDVTSEIYGRGPITFVPVRRDVRRIQFRPRSEGGGIIDPNVPIRDKRLVGTTDASGVYTPPLATTFIEFVVLLLRSGKVPEPIVISIKVSNKWQRKAANQLTTFIKLRHAPIFSGLYTVSTGVGKNDKGTFGVFIFKNSGFIPVDTPIGAALFKHAEEFSASLEGKEIVTDREPGSDDEFDVDAMEANPEM